ncbi:MAG TPA: glycosyltransferase family 39 protein [Streptosporangiaceae bacterium]
MDDRPAAARFAESQAAGMAVLTDVARRSGTSATLPAISTAAIPAAAIPAAADPIPAIRQDPLSPPARATPPGTEQDDAPAAGRAQSRWPAVLRWALLTVILAAQAALSAPLAWVNTAYVAEASALAAGHAEIAHWLHGSPSPAYATWFSGAPVLYPPLGALADSAGGLTAARLLSLAFMLGVTALLWATASRLLGRRAGACAAALFAVCAPALQLGSFATADALGLLLLAAAAWCVVSAQDRDDSALRLVTGAALIALANATKYSTILFDPAVIALAGLAVAGRSGTKPAIARCGYLAAGTTGLVSALIAIGGPRYEAGVLTTTFSRGQGGHPPLPVLTEALPWIAPVMALAAAGIAVSALRGNDRVRTLTLVILAAFGVAAPLNEARLHTAVSLARNCGFGLWFAAIAAGYAIAALSRLLPGAGRPVLRLAVPVALLAAVTVPAAWAGQAQAAKLARSWPDSASLTAYLRAAVQAHPGQYLAEDEAIPAYYLRSVTPVTRWSGTSYFHYDPPGPARPLTGLPAFRAAIRAHYFAVVVLDFASTRPADWEIAAELNLAGGYHSQVVRSSAGQYTIWIYEPAAGGGP